MKQSAAVMALFLGTATAIRRTPESINLFATGASGDEDLNQNIIMKGDKYHYNQFSQVEITEGAEGAPVNRGVRFIQGEPEKKDAKPEAKPEEKKEEKKDEKKEEEKKDEKKDDKKDDKKEDKKDDKKEDKKDDKKEDKKDDKKEDKKEGDEEKKDEKKDDEKKDDKEEKKEEKKDAKPGEATWEDHNACKENEWEAADGNCAFEAENLIHITGNNDIMQDLSQKRSQQLIQLGDLDQGMQFVQLQNGNGLWMKNKKDDTIAEDFTGKIDSVRGPPMAPIGYGVHDLASSVDPYAAKKIVGEPVRGLQHQPVILPADFYKGTVAEPEKLSPEMEYRREVASKGVQFKDANFGKLVAAGMTDGPKMKWGFNSILNDIEKKPVDADKEADAKVKADPNAGAPAADAPVSPEKAKKALAAAAKDAPNPNAKPEDPATDPAASAKAANDMEASSAKKNAETDKKAAPKAALSQMRDEDPTKIESVRGPSNGAPIGYGVHKLANEGGAPYAGKQMYRAEQPVNGVQHQPVMIKEDKTPEAPVAKLADKNMQYRKELGETGLRADETNFGKLIAAGMTDGPKMKWGFNSILNDVKAKEEKADKDKNASVVADPNAGAPEATAELSPAKAAAALKAMAKDAPNPMAKPEDPATDPAAVAKASNAADDSAATKPDAKIAPKATPKAALAQGADEVDPTKIESVRGPPSAPIGYGVHKLANEGGAPYAGKQMYRAGEPTPGVQHQPVMLPADFYRGEAAKPAPLSPEMQYRTEIGSKGVKAEDATWKDLVAAGMTDTPKVRFNNSILNNDKNATKDAIPELDKDAAKSEATAKAAADAKVATAAAAPVTVQKEKKEAAAPLAEVAAPVAAPAAKALVQKMDTIGEPKYEYSVFDFSHNAIYDPLEKARQTESQPSYNGEFATKWSLAQQLRNKNDISDKNIDEEVVGFVRADKNTVPYPLARRETAAPLNGWDNTPPSTITNLYQRNARDISDKNIDEEVVGLVRADKNMMPIPQFARRTTAYPVNGYANSPPSTVTNLYQRNARDISDKNIDEEVVGLVRADKNMMPIPQFARRDTAYPVNGYANSPPSTVTNLHQMRDIAQPGVEPNVYDFVNDKVEALNWERRPTAFNNNGYAADAWSLAQQQDIADKEVRPDVYVTVKNMVDPAAHFRSDKAPKDSYQPYQGVQEPFPKGAAKEAEKNPDGLDFVQTDAQFLGNPERVNVIDPIAYQTRANGNTIDGGIQIRRTTFY